MSWFAKYSVLSTNIVQWGPTNHVATTPSLRKIQDMVKGRIVTDTSFDNEIYVHNKCDLI